AACRDQRLSRRRRRPLVDDVRRRIRLHVHAVEATVGRAVERAAGGRNDGGGRARIRLAGVRALAARPVAPVARLARAAVPPAGGWIAELVVDVERGLAARLVDEVAAVAAAAGNERRPRRILGADRTRVHAVAAALVPDGAGEALARARVPPTRAVG